MKKYYLLIALATLTACSSFGKVTVTKDEFKGSTIVQLKLRHKSKEDFGIFSYNIAEVTYVREIAANATESLKFQVKSAYLPIEGGFNLDEGGFLKVDDRQIDIKLENRGNHTQTQTTSSKKKDDEEVKTTTINYATGDIQIDPKLIPAISDAKSLALRLYYKSKSLTFIFDEDDIAKLKEFLAAK
jgi:hypothetical protein